MAALENADDDPHAEGMLDNFIEAAAGDQFDDADEGNDEEHDDDDDAPDLEDVYQDDDEVEEPMDEATARIIRDAMKEHMMGASYDLCEIEEEYDEYSDYSDMDDDSHLKPETRAVIRAQDCRGDDTETFGFKYVHA
jgi:hypothetical protein